MLVTTYRQLTGAPRIRHAYVRDTVAGKTVAACRHAHRSDWAAQACANRMLRTLVRASERPYVVSPWRGPSSFISLRVIPLIAEEIEQVVGPEPTKEADA